MRLSKIWNYSDQGQRYLPKPNNAYQGLNNSDILCKPIEFNNYVTIHFGRKVSHANKNYVKRTTNLKPNLVSLHSDQSKKTRLATLALSLLL